MLHALFRILEGLQCQSVLAFKDQCHQFSFTVFQSLFTEASDGELTTEFLEVGAVGALPSLSPVPVQHHYIK